MEPLRRLAPAAIGIAALLLLFPLVDYLGNAWPFRPGAVDWRYGVVGMISTYLGSPLLGLLVLSITAASLTRPRLSRVLGAVCWLAAVLLLAALGLFLLDSIQVRSSAPANARWVTTTSFLLASGKILLAAIALMLLGAGNLRAGRDGAATPASRKRVPPETLIGQRQ